MTEQSYYYVCDACGITEHRKPVAGGEAWSCASCGSEAAWEFTDARAAADHSAHIRSGVTSGLFRRHV